MKTILTIAQYVDTIEVYVDRIKVDIKKLSFFSKAEFEFDVTEGTHEIVVTKNSEVLEKDWGKKAFYKWVSALFGVPDFTLKEILQDTKTHSIKLLIKIENNTNIFLNLTSQGFELINEEKVLSVKKETVTSKIAERRVKFIYVFPAILAVALIEILFLTISVFFLMNVNYLKSVIVFGISLFWILLMFFLIKKSLKK